MFISEEEDSSEGEYTDDSDDDIFADPESIKPKRKKRKKENEVVCNMV